MDELEQVKLISQGYRDGVEYAAKIYENQINTANIAISRAQYELKRLETALDYLRINMSGSPSVVVKEVKNG